MVPESQVIQGPFEYNPQLNPTTETDVRIHTAKKEIFDKILERKKKEEFKPYAVDLTATFKEILSRANRFVPSESGSILLDDPLLNQDRKKSGHLYFVACFGKGSDKICGTPLSIGLGVAGRTYRTGRAYISRNAVDDSNFYNAIDKKTKFQTKSIIAAPIKIKGVTIGVIELLNRVGHINYGSDDLSLLKIFAEYTSTLIQNSLDAKRFGELSMRDNLTGLYNDRYFYDRLTKEASVALKKGRDLSLIFLDLDRFKEVNDTHGHLAGSRVLTEVGQMLALECLVIKNAAAARYGGDEFVVILPDTSLQKAAELSERIRRCVEGYTFLKTRYPGIGRSLNIRGVITCSLGAASLKDCELKEGSVREARDSLIKLADSLMYRSKEAGKNTVSVPGPDRPHRKIA